MRNIYIIACSKEKTSHESLARDLYTSRSFKLRRQLAEAYADRWFILSGKFGLLEPDSVVAPYDRSLDDVGDHDRRQWLNSIQKVLEPYLGERANFVCLGDNRYFGEISYWLVRNDVSVFIPYRHLPERIRAAWLQNMLPHSKLMNDIAALHTMLGDPILRETQMRYFAECSGSMMWPQRGLYVFYELGHNRMISPRDLKIVRVGTHAVSEGASSTLWQRLKTHKGNEDFSGNHRSSVFRLHIGAALIERDGLDCPSWGIAQPVDRSTKESEDAVERRVSEYLRSMNVLSIRVEDPPSKTSDRAYIEQNMIALLSCQYGPVDLAKESWLGYDCPNPAVRRSSLWNVECTDTQYDPNFLEVLQAYIDVTTGRIRPPEHSLAPVQWLQRAKSGYRQGRLDFG